jgi:hypothetical protein
MRYLTTTTRGYSTTPASADLDGAIMHGKAKKQKMTVLFFVGIFCFFALTGLAAVSTARAENTPPRWVITSTSDPTNIVPNSPATEVLHIDIDATGGTFTLDALGTRLKTKPIAYDATPKEVLEALGEEDANFTEPGPGGGIVPNGGPEGLNVEGAPGAYEVIYSPDTSLAAIGVESEPITADGSGLTQSGECVAGTPNSCPGSATVSVASTGKSLPRLVLTAINVGGSSTNGGPVTISDTLPAGFTSVEGHEPYHPGTPATGMEGIDAYHFLESTAGPNPGDGTKEPVCVNAPVIECTFSGPIDPGDNLIVNIDTKVAGPPEVKEGETVVNHASVSGGGAPTAVAESPITISSAPARYGVVPGSVVSALSSTQAGAHANDTTAFTLNTGPFEAPVAAPRDVEFDAPVGLVGDAVDLPKCSSALVEEGGGNFNLCPSDTIVGTATLSIHVVAAGSTPYVGEAAPVYNIAPAPGEPAAFEFMALGQPIRLDASVLSEGDYGIRVTAPHINENGEDIYSAVTLWGVPGDYNGPGPDVALAQHFGGPGTDGQTAFLSNPTQCSEPVTGTLLTDSWPEPNKFVPTETEQREPGFGDPAPSGTMTGCDALPFSTGVSMVPDTAQAGAPAGYDFNLYVDRSQDSNPEGNVAPDVKNVSTTLPLGTVISPSAANGLGACKDDENVNPAEVPNEFGLHSLELASCSIDSQVGTVEIESPDIKEAFGGDVYLAEPECNPCSPQDAEDGKMVKLLLQAKGKGEAGILVKTSGWLSVNQQTGQLTATFENEPQLPFTHLELKLAGGPRATLSNPRTCGTATTSVDLTPWTTPYEPDAIDTSPYQVTGCQGAAGVVGGNQFNPSFFAGTTSNQAGGFTPFTLSFTRTDPDQYLAGIQLKTPPGLVGSLANVPLCPEPQAAQGACSPASEIGTTQVETGPGAEPFLVVGGKIYLTGPYKGAPFGLSIVVPAKAGPYTLTGTTGVGTVVVRSTINIDPTTSALTVTSDPLPTILDGIPLQLKLVNVTINRQDFIFNPTSCNKMAITATLSSSQGGSTTRESSFQVTNCEALKFQPKFTVSTSGKTSKANGASLDAKVSYPNTGQGTQANIAMFKVDLPKQLPSRLTTLQKACTAAQFESNPAGCPAASVIGTVRVNTPVLPVQLTGPVYFVSHGGEAFPSLEIVLQGDGVRVDVVASTFISKAGITSSTFKTVPDVPFSNFELYLPEGKYSALAANGNLCKSKLAMPTAIVAQNGAEIHESTKIAVTGCPKAKKAAKKKKAHTANKARKSTNGRRAQS